MAKFCTNCGKKLKDGEVCDCQTKTVVNSDIKDSLLDVLKGMFVKPIDTLKEYVKESNFTLALILVGILALSTGLFAMSLCKNAYTLIMSSMGVGSFSYGFGSVSIEIPYAKVFFTSVIVLMVLSFVYTGILYLVNTIIFKRQSSFKETYAAYGVSSALMSVSLLAGSILLFVHVGLGALVLALGSILNMVYSYHSLKFLGTEDENKYGYIYLITSVLFYLAIFIISKVLS